MTWTNFWVKQAERIDRGLHVDGAGPWLSFSGTPRKLSLPPIRFAFPLRSGLHCLVLALVGSVLSFLRGVVRVLVGDVPLTPSQDGGAQGEADHAEHEQEHQAQRRRVGGRHGVRHLVTVRRRDLRDRNGVACCQLAVSSLKTRRMGIMWECWNPFRWKNRWLSALI